MDADRRILMVAALAAALAGCGDGDRPRPAPVAAAPAPFSLEVFPTSMAAIPGQRCVLLVRAADTGSGEGQGEPVMVSASATGPSLTVEHASVGPGEVAEITALTDGLAPGSSVQVVVVGQRRGLQESRAVTLEVVQGDDGLLDQASMVRDTFVPWLEANFPELGIDGQTVWTGTYVRPGVLIVAYYLFFSEDWEMDVEWHVMIPPHDWARIHLRRRFAEMAPSRSFEISSMESHVDPVPIPPPDEVVR